MAKRILTEADIIPNAEYAKTRGEWRKKITDKKRYRRVDVGPCITCLLYTSPSPRDTR